MTQAGDITSTSVYGVPISQIIERKISEKGLFSELGSFNLPYSIDWGESFESASYLDKKEGWEVTLNHLDYSKAADEGLVGVVVKGDGKPLRYREYTDQYIIPGKSAVVRVLKNDEAERYVSELQKAKKVISVSANFIASVKNGDNTHLIVDREPVFDFNDLRLLRPYFKKYKLELILRNSGEDVMKAFTTLAKNGQYVWDRRLRYWLGNKPTWIYNTSDYDGGIDYVEDATPWGWAKNEFTLRNFELVVPEEEVNSKLPIRLSTPKISRIGNTITGIVTSYGIQAALLGLDKYFMSSSLSAVLSKSFEDMFGKKKQIKIPEIFTSLAYKYAHGDDGQFIAIESPSVKELVNQFLGPLYET